MNLAEVTRLEVLRKAEEETHGWKLFIGGERVDSASGARYETIDPSLDTPIAAVPDGKAAAAVVAGMNFTRSQAQSCGSNSRVFVHRGASTRSKGC